MKQLSLLDLPHDILENIFLRVISDLNLNPFLKHITKKGQLVCATRINAYKYYCRYKHDTDICHKQYSLYLKNNSHCCVLPSTLCILSRVCKDLKYIMNNYDYWKTLYIRDCRGGKPYKYDNKDYKKLYFQNIYQYYHFMHKDTIFNIDFTRKKISSKVTNANILMNQVRGAVWDDGIDFPDHIYYIYGLRDVELVQTDWNGGKNACLIQLEEKELEFEEILQYRRECICNIMKYDEEYEDLIKQRDKVNKIMDGLKIQGCTLFLTWYMETLNRSQR